MGKKVANENLSGHNLLLLILLKFKLVLLRCYVR